MKQENDHKNFRMPKHKGKIGFGLGMDLKWGFSKGFFENKENFISEKLQKFLIYYKENFDYYFISFQPRNRNKLDCHDYLNAYKAFNSIMNSNNIKIMSLHHTMLNLGALEEYETKNIIDFTNILIDELNLEWINEDVGIWSIFGKSLPYPLPPIFTFNSLKKCIKNVNHYQKNLIAPLVIEFPGFTEGSSFYVGKLNAVNFFKELALETFSPITIDTGHILGWLSLLGIPLNEFHSEVMQFPLENCIEIHLSGSAIISGKFRDLHHGILMQEQFDILDFLIEKCKNLKVITYEDPVFTDDGFMVKRSQDSFEKLKNRVEQWKLYHV